MTDSEEYHLLSMLPSSWMATTALKNQMQKGDGHREGKMFLILSLNIVKQVFVL